MVRALRVFSAVLGLAFALPSLAAEYRDPAEHFFQAFLGDLRAEIDDARSSGRKGVVVMYHFEECPACTRMKKEVLSRPEVQTWYRREFAVIGIDTRGAQSITGLDGKIHPENQYARTVAIKGTPTFDFYGVEGSLQYRHVGGIYDPAEFLLLGQFVASGAFRGQTFADFKRDHRGVNLPSPTSPKGK